MGYFRMTDGVLDYVPFLVPKKSQDRVFQKIIAYV